jgi:cell division protein FtsL
MTPPAASHAHAAPPLAPRRRTGAPPRPRRVSGPARPPARRPAPAARPARTAQGGLALGLIGLAGRLDALASHRLLDRLIRSRVWIGIIAFALIGIVTLQLGLLKLNSGIGRSLERAAALQRENAALSVENSELASGSRVESQAEQLGMRLVSVGGLQFLGSHSGSDLSRAAAALGAAHAHEATTATTQAAAPSSEEATHESSAEAGPESAGTSSASASTSTSTSTSASTGESSPPSETAASGAPASESTTATAGAEAKSETSGEPVQTGVGGGAAAPGG